MSGILTKTSKRLGGPASQGPFHTSLGVAGPQTAPLTFSLTFDLLLPTPSKPSVWAATGSPIVMGARLPPSPATVLRPPPTSRLTQKPTASSFPRNKLSSLALDRPKSPLHLGPAGHITYPTRSLCQNPTGFLPHSIPHQSEVYLHPRSSCQKPGPGSPDAAARGE